MGITVDNPGLLGRLRFCAAVTGVFLLLTDALPAEPDGEAIYRFYCYQCHGYAGNAETLASASLSPPPRWRRSAWR